MDVYLVWRDIMYEQPDLLGVYATVPEAMAKVRSLGLPYGHAASVMDDGVFVERWTVGGGDDREFVGTLTPKPT